MKNWSATPPEWSAFECVDGFAWHPRESLRHCHKGRVACSAETLGTVYEGAPIERLLALRSLLLEGRNQRLVLVRVFPDCELCRTPRRADQLRGIWRRASMTIHEDAIPYVRDANPGLHLFLNANIPTPRARESNAYKNMAAQAIPVRDPKWDRRRPPTDEATRTAQIWWASNLIAAKEARVA